MGQTRGPLVQRSVSPSGQREALGKPHEQGMKAGALPALEVSYSTV